MSYKTLFNELSKADFSMIDFKCTATNAFISAQLSNHTFQLRNIAEFNGIAQVIDTPPNTIQGFVVNIACDNFQSIFTQVCIYWLSMA